MVDCSIIIVNWNVKDLLHKCLSSIYSAVPHSYRFEVLVVDSASADGSAAMVEQQFPQVHLFSLRENVGFTRGNNIALEAAQGRYLFLLNPDTEIVGNALGVLLDFMETHAEAGIIGPHTLNTDGTTQSTRRRFPTLGTAFFESTWLQAYAPQRIFDRYYARDIADAAIAEVDWVQGSALLARRAVYEQIGPLDEGFIMYSEELDWCKRSKTAGWKVFYVGTAQIIHHGGKSSEQVSAYSHIQYQRSKLRYFRKYWGVLVAQVLRLFLLLNYVWQIGIEGAKGLAGHKRSLRRDRIHIYWQILRTGLKVS
jgi:N-acetylglucosaminyl-diphospho-decaprenol L-rhamnosyltransferase